MTNFNPHYNLFDLGLMGIELILHLFSLKNKTRTSRKRKNTFIFNKLIKFFEISTASDTIIGTLQTLLASSK